MPVQKPSDASVYSHVPLTHDGKEVPVGTDLRQLGLESHQLKGLRESGEADTSRPNSREG